MKYSYTKDELFSALSEVGLCLGDAVLVHSDMVSLGIPKEFVEHSEAVCGVVYDSIRTIVGEKGTIIVPTFTYSFCKGEDFDVDGSPSKVGSFSEFVRRLPGAVRNNDPLFSFAAIGPERNLITDYYSNSTFSPESSPFRNFYSRNVKILLLGVDLRYLTAAHFSEQRIAAPHRFDKLFSGRLIVKDKIRKISWVYSVRVNIPQTRQRLVQLHEDCLMAGVLAKASDMPVYAGQLVDILDIFERRSVDDRWRYLEGPCCDPAAEDRCRTGEEHFDVTLFDTSLEAMAYVLTPLPRHLVSDGYDAALNALARAFPMRVHAYPTGTHAFTWIVPERWICHGASLETVDGHKIFSTEDNQLHVVSYSNPFSGTVSREELLAHLHTPRPSVAKRYPDAIPFVFKYYERDWGLCCSSQVKSSLTDEFYHVRIDSDFSVGSVKVGEVVVQGQREDCIVFCAHLCHPGQLSDGLSGVLVGLKLMERLRHRASLRHTWRMLILPETIGSACWLSHNRDVIPHLKGGMFLEMLATQYPHVLMHSNEPESWFDKIASLVVSQEDPASTTVPFLEAPLNDERMFNAAGIRCPMCSLLRIASREDGLWPYAEYHTSLDTCENADFANLARTVDLLERIVDAAETDRVPTPLWQGELFVSRFNGLDYARDGKILREIVYGMDGKRSISDIARLRCVGFFEVKRVLDILEQERLIAYDEVKHG